MADTPRTETAIAKHEPPQALARPALGLPTPSELATMETLGQMYQQSGLLPSGVKNWQAAVISIQAGRELGIPPTVAIREIYVVNGRPTCSAQLMMSLIRRDYGGQAIRVRESTNEACTVEFREPGWDGISSHTFTIEDAKKAKLAGKDTWTSYPRAMLRNRAVSEVARRAFPDCISGMYTPEELGAPVDEEGRIHITGEVIDIATGEIRDRSQALATVSVETDDEARERLTRAVHAEGKKRGWEHEHLSFLLNAKFGHGFTAATPFEVDSLLIWLSNGNGNVDTKLEQIKSAIAAGDGPTAEQAELINDPELQAAADRVQAASRARGDGV